VDYQLAQVTVAMTLAPFASPQLSTLTARIEENWPSGGFRPAPTVAESKQKLLALSQTGPSRSAFTLSAPFPKPILRSP
jgi:hypothetical protein